jgi:hypothetical protein
MPTQKAFFCSIMGENYHFMHPLGPTWNKEMFDDGKKIM